jgi:hypothetical protein
MAGKAKLAVERPGQTAASCSLLQPSLADCGQLLASCGLPERWLEVVADVWEVVAATGHGSSAMVVAEASCYRPRRGSRWSGGDGAPTLRNREATPREKQVMASLHGERRRHEGRSQQTVT